MLHVGIFVRRFFGWLTRDNCMLTLIPLNRTSIRRVRPAQDHAQSRTESRDMSTRTSKYHAPLNAPSRSRASRPRSSLRRPTRTSRTPSCRVRALDVLSRRDRCHTRTGARARSCGARKQQTINAREQAHRGRAAAAHQMSRPAPTSAGPPSEALKDRGPAHKRGCRRWDYTDLGPDTPA